MAKTGIWSVPSAGGTMSQGIRAASRSQGTDTILECPKGTQLYCHLEFSFVRPSFRLLISKTIRKQMCVVNKI